MQLDTIDLIRRVLPRDLPLTYYADRESAWLLAQLMQGDASVSALRASGAAKLLDRPAIRPLVARCGGHVRHRDVLALAHADRSALTQGASRAGEPALDALFCEAWEDYTLSFDVWGSRQDWRYDQISRPGSNLVIQLGFPEAHASIFGRSFARETRKAYECRWHPIRTEGPPTLAWTRVDIELDTGEALIEEVQSDWLRLASRYRLHRARDGAQERELRVLNAYEAALTARYAKTWPRVMLLAALFVLRQELGVRSVWMHQPETGACLKGIEGRQPPRSLYSTLPRSFCFEATREVPPFIAKARRRHLGQLTKRKGPLFWHLSL